MQRTSRSACRFAAAQGQAQEWLGRRPSGSIPSPELVEENGREDNEALHDVLEVGVDTQQIQAVRDHPQNEHASDDTNDGAAAAVEAGASDEDGSDGGELVADAGRRLRR